MMARRSLRGAFALLALLSCTIAHAQLFRAYLDSTGSDANPCTLSAPCRLLPAALAAVADGGEIWMLDSANFNTATVSITKSVTILAVPGVVGSLVALGGPAISMPGSGSTVVLRNLMIVPFPGAGVVDGVQLLSSSRLTVEHCVIANLGGNGVSLTGNGKVKIVDSILRNNGGYGLKLLNGGVGEISTSQLLNNGNGGLFVNSKIATLTTATVTDSNISGNGEGLYAQSEVASAITRIFVARSTLEANNFALDSETVAGAGTALITVNGSTIVGNIYGIFQSGAGSSIRTYGNNQFSDNETSAGVLTSGSLQ
jgi:hypothetical protein